MRRTERVQKKRAEQTPLLDEVTIKSHQSNYRNRNKIDLVRADIRNVLFCGATRSGKTNCFRVMQDPCYCPEQRSIFSETRGTNFKSFSLKDNESNSVHSFILSLIDSPGAFEEQSSDKEFKTRTNEKIGELIVECLKNNVAYLNLVVLFLPIGARIDSKDVKAIELFVEMFQRYENETASNEELSQIAEEIQLQIKELQAQPRPDLEELEILNSKLVAVEKRMSLPMILCLTHADKESEASRNNYVEQLVQQKDLKKYFDSKLLSLVFMGCADYRFSNYGSEQQYLDTLDNVVYWREIFFDAIFESKYRIDLSSTQIFNQRQKDIAEILKTCLLELERLPKCDTDTADYKLRIEYHKHNMEILFSHKLILDGLDECKSDTATLWETINSIRIDRTIKDDQKMDLLSPWDWKQ